MYATLSEVFTALSNAARAKKGTEEQYKPEEAIEIFNNLIYDNKRDYVGIKYDPVRMPSYGFLDLLFRDFNAYLGDHYDSTKSAGENFLAYRSEYPNGYNVHEGLIELYNAQKNCIVLPDGTGSTEKEVDLLPISNVTVEVESIINAQSVYDLEKNVPLINYAFTFLLPKKGYNKISTFSDYNMVDVLLACRGYVDIANSYSGFDMFSGSAYYDRLTSLKEKLSEFFMSNGITFNFDVNYSNVFNAIKSDINGGRISEKIISKMGLLGYLGDTPIISVGDSNAFVTVKSVPNCVKREYAAPYVNITELSLTEEEEEELSKYYNLETEETSEATVLTNPLYEGTTCAYLYDKVDENEYGIRIPVNGSCDTIYYYEKRVNITGYSPEIVKNTLVKYDQSATSIDDLTSPATMRVLVDFQSEESNNFYTNIINGFLQINNMVNCSFNNNGNGNQGTLTVYLKDLKRVSSSLFSNASYKSIPDTTIIGENCTTINKLLYNTPSGTAPANPKKIYFTSMTPPTITTIQTFQGFLDNFRLFCPVGSLSAYQAAFQAWSGIISEGEAPIIPLSKAEIMRIGESLVNP